ncbi:uncharacterized protein A1O5_13008 [Cladophialophora psammophila CBS 110553]|uniref:CFEM domain-containing protein n=1 Tax=Cladophialophora psammophila CBS 110553 TaxID=1182543 RepID=W9W5B6_9EURO|nr:uncharacterized protein A1O5_13008 [Cladophialophora psammophila CBS 110553]EXJ53759.1 hypothetical protein A1O5_13008 [Cladophialophora psammophila CBS 110553]
MAFKLLVLLSALPSIFPRFASANYESWTGLPYCAQDCFSKAINDSLSTCTDVSLDCFCRNTDAAKKFDFCLETNVPCDSNPINNDVEIFKNRVFCNASANSGFKYTVIKGAMTVTLGSASGGDEAATVSDSDQTQACYHVTLTTQLHGSKD